MRARSSASLLVVLAACGPEAPSTPSRSQTFLQTSITSADIVIAVDNSGSMAEEQSRLMANVARVIDVAVASGASLRFGVVTSDAESNPEGLLVGVPVGNNPDAPNLPVSVRDRAGNLVRALPDDSGEAAVPFCAAAVEAVAPKGGVIDIGDPALHAIVAQFPLIPDFTGRGAGFFLDTNADGIADNLIASSLADIVGCFVSVGERGTGLESQLGQVAAALDGDSLQNHHPLLLSDPGSLLAVLLLSDEDDCSVFEGAEVSAERFVAGPHIGILNSIQCVVPSSVEVCQDGPGILDSLVPVEALAERLKALRPDEQLFVAAVAGPTGEVVIPDCSEAPSLPVPSCAGTGGVATPGNRLSSFVAQFSNHITPDAAPICGEFSSIIGQLADNLAAELNLRCLDVALEADVTADTEIRVSLSLDGLTDDSGAALDCASLGEGVATTREEGGCVVSPAFFSVQLEDACLQAGNAGPAVFFGFDVPVGASVEVVYTPAPADS